MRDRDSTTTSAASAVSKSVQPSRNEVPLCVDLDGTLIKTDLLLESLVVLLKGNLLYLFVVALLAAQRSGSSEEANRATGDSERFLPALQFPVSRVSDRTTSGGPAAGLDYCR